LLPLLDDVEMELAYRDLHWFIRLLWPTVEADTYVDGWHIDYICQHLEAVYHGAIRNLLINMPPRHMKSLAVAVFFVTWVWLRDPYFRWLFSSYAQSLSTRDSVKCRRLIQSPVYQALLAKYQPDFVLTGDQNTKTRFDNIQGGYRLATSVGGSNTGEGGDCLIADDPNNVMKVESDAERVGVNEWWDEVMSSRLNDPKTGRKIIIQQRSHQNDLSGHVLEKMANGNGDGEVYEHLCLPARYEGENRIITSLGLIDPRTTTNEPLYPDRFGDLELRMLESALGTYGAAGQLQQRPSPKEGGMFKVERFKVAAAIDKSRVKRVVRYWDKAASENKGSPFSAGVRMLLMNDDSFVVDDVIQGRWSYRERNDVIRSTARQDALQYGLDALEIYVEQEPGSGGKESALTTVAELRGYNAYVDIPSGDKEVRAQPYAAQVEGYNVTLIWSDSWSQKYKDELRLFPNSKFKDMTDASSGAFKQLNPATELIAGVWGERSLVTRTHGRTRKY